MSFRILLALGLTSCLCLSLSAGEKAEVKPVNLDKLNTEADEEDPCPVDNLTLLYAATEAGKYEIRMSQRRSTVGPWQPGKLFLGSEEYDCRSPFYYLRTKTLYL